MYCVEYWSSQHRSNLLFGFPHMGFHIKYQFCQPGPGSHQMDQTAPSVPVTKRSMWSCRGTSAVTVAPGCIFTSGWIRYQFCQPGPGSHQVDQTAPSVPVTKRSM